ncbi:MAG: hypothetical protein SXV54_24270, partial [Chloroflexota bacterium]|nr:hypothetical protein [Chloroflexota bacterium]
MTDNKKIGKPELQRLIRLSAYAAPVAIALLYQAGLYLNGAIGLPSFITMTITLVTPIIYALLNESPARIQELVFTFLRIAKDAADGKIDDKEQLRKLEDLLRDVVHAWD